MHIYCSTLPDWKSYHPNRKSQIAVVGAEKWGEREANARARQREGVSLSPYLETQKETQKTAYPSRTAWEKHEAPRKIEGSIRESYKVRKENIGQGEGYFFFWFFLSAHETTMGTNFIPYAERMGVAWRQTDTSLGCDQRKAAVGRWRVISSLRKAVGVLQVEGMRKEKRFFS